MNTLIHRVRRKLFNPRWSGDSNNMHISLNFKADCRKIAIKWLKMFTEMLLLTTHEQMVMADEKITIRKLLYDNF